MTAQPEPLLVIDIGGTTVKYGVWAHQHLSHQDCLATPQTWPELLAAIVQIRQGLALPFIGVAISLPGSVDTVAGKISGTSAVDYLNGFPIKEALHQALDLPVSIQNDANCAALAEIWQGNARDVTDVALLVLGTGVGGAVVLNHQLVAGRQNFAGEFGYQVMTAQGETLSELGSPVRMAERYSRLAKLTVPVSAKAVYLAAEQGDDLAQFCIDDMLTWLSCAAFNLFVSLNPQRLLIGGGISGRPDFVAELKCRVQALMSQHGAPLAADIMACKYHNAANLIGAVYQFYLENGDDVAVSVASA